MSDARGDGSVDERRVGVESVISAMAVGLGQSRSGPGGNDGGLAIALLLEIAHGEYMRV